MNHTNIMLTALHFYGTKAQQFMLVEELSELNKEFAKDLNGRQKDNYKLFDEIADVLVMIQQAKIWIGKEQRDSFFNSKEDFNKQFKDRFLDESKRYDLVCHIVKESSNLQLCTMEDIMDSRDIDRANFIKSLARLELFLEYLFRFFGKDKFDLIDKIKNEKISRLRDRLLEAGAKVQ